MTAKLVDMTNEEWLRHILDRDCEEDSLDAIMDTIDDAYDRPARVDVLLTWLDPSALTMAGILSVLSIARRPTVHLFPMAAAIGRGEEGPSPVSLPGIDTFARRALAVVREREPTRVFSLLRGLIDDSLLREEEKR